MRPAGDPAEEWFGNETFFLRRGDRVSTVTSGFAAVNFDPDVFADALVFLPVPLLEVPRPALPHSFIRNDCRRAASCRDAGSVHRALRRWLSLCQATA